MSLLQSELSRVLTNFTDVEIIDHLMKLERVIPELTAMMTAASTDGEVYKLFNATEHCGGACPIYYAQQVFTDGPVFYFESTKPLDEIKDDFIKYVEYGTV